MKSKRIVVESQDGDYKSDVLLTSYEIEVLVSLINREKNSPVGLKFL
jgi:hypothetical protein